MNGNSSHNNSYRCLAHHQLCWGDFQWLVFCHMDTTILPSSTERTIYQPIIMLFVHDILTESWILSLMEWDGKLQCPTPSGGLFGFYKGYLHPHSPNDLGTSMPTSWCIPMACQPLPLGFYNLLKIQTPPLWTASLHIKQHFSKRKYPFRKGRFVMTMMVFSKC
jgi:hypothetical protein